MIEQIKGVIEKKNKNSLIISVSDISYKIKASLNCITGLPQIGERASLLTYLHVRENLLDLYGFKNDHERKSFFFLIGISGIGPKLALIILSGLKFRDLKDYVIDGDVKSLTSIPGVGSKTAKRMIIELKEKFIDLDDDDLGIKEKYNDDSGLFDNVVNALVNLGYKKTEATKVCNKLVDKGEFNGSLEILIKKSLHSLISRDT
jgi:holliday junction DNA helicase RuvA